MAKYYKEGDRIWWSQPQVGTAGRKIYKGKIKRVFDSATAGRLYLVEKTKGDTVTRMVSHTRAMVGKPPKEHEGYE